MSENPSQQPSYGPPGDGGAGPQAGNPPYGAPAQQGYGQQAPAQQPYGSYGTGPGGFQPQQYGQYPGYGSGTQDAPPQRSTAMTVVGSIFAFIAALFALSFLVNLSRTSSMGGGAGFIIGYLIGGLIIVGIPALIAYLCFTAHTRKAKKLR